MTRQRIPVEVLPSKEQSLQSREEWITEGVTQNTQGLLSEKGWKKTQMMFPSLTNEEAQMAYDQGW